MVPCCRFAMLSVLLLCLIASLRDATACTGAFYPTATLVTDSPLIFLGRIESVEEMPGESGGNPKVAYVKVLRVIAGPLVEGRLRVLSGPLRS